MRIDVVTIFPEFFASPLEESIIRRGRERGLLDIRVHDLRGWTTDRHKVTDDAPYGGGVGMVMKPEPLFAAVEALREQSPAAATVLLTPQGRVWNQALVREFGARPALILLCGRYEGVDERVIEALIDEEISIGDYVLTGGEAAALVLVETVAREVPGQEKLLELNGSEWAQNRHLDFFMELAEQGEAQLVVEEQMVWLERL